MSEVSSNDKPKHQATSLVADNQVTDAQENHSVDETPQGSAPEQPISPIVTENYIAPEFENPTQAPELTDEASTTGKPTDDRKYVTFGDLRRTLLTYKAFTLIFAGVVAATSFLSWCSSRDQAETARIAANTANATLAEMKDSSADTKKLAQAALDQAKATKSIADAANTQANAALALANVTQEQRDEMSNQSGLMSNSLIELRQSVDLAQLQVNEMRKQARASQESADTARQGVELSLDALRYSQAAYVVVRGARFSEVAGATPTIFLEVINTGNTPATNAAFYTNQRVVVGPGTAIEPPFPTTFEDSDDSSSRAVMGPGVRFDLPVEAVKLANFKTNGLRIYVMGIANYTDIFKRRRWTKFCFVQKWPDRFLTPCANNNEVDGQD